MCKLGFKFKLGAVGTDSFFVFDGVSSGSHFVVQVADWPLAWGILGAGFVWYCCIMGVFCWFAVKCGLS